MLAAKGSYVGSRLIQCIFVMARGKEKKRIHETARTQKRREKRSLFIVTEETA
jgi:hypothetical protein